MLGAQRAEALDEGTAEDVLPSLLKAFSPRSSSALVESCPQRRRRWTRSCAALVVLGRVEEGVGGGGGEDQVHPAVEALGAGLGEGVLVLGA